MPNKKIIAWRELKALVGGNIDLPEGMKFISITAEDINGLVRRAEGNEDLRKSMLRSAPVRRQRTTQARKERPVRKQIKKEVNPRFIDARAEEVKEVPEKKKHDTRMVITGMDPEVINSAYQRMKEIGLNPKIRDNVIYYNAKSLRQKKVDFLNKLMKNDFKSRPQKDIVYEGIGAQRPKDWEIRQYSNQIDPDTNQPYTAYSKRGITNPKIRYAQKSVMTKKQQEDIQMIRNEVKSALQGRVIKQNDPNRQAERDEKKLKRKEKMNKILEDLQRRS